MKNTILSLLSMIFIFNINSQNSQEFTINAGNYYYSPSSLTINVGDVVNWYNDGGFHNVNFDINSITYESFGNPESFSSSATSAVGALIYSHVFNTPGTYTYDCSIGSHAANGMVGTIVVEETTEGDVALCENSDNGASDSYGDTCASWYDANESPGSYGCSGAYDTADFIAAEMCCACGGGSTAGQVDGGDNSGEVACEDTCIYANDGVCDDGSPGSDYSFCDLGTDCSDCNNVAPEPTFVMMKIRR